MLLPVCGPSNDRGEIGLHSWLTHYPGLQLTKLLPQVRVRGWDDLHDGGVVGLDMVVLGYMQVL